MAILLPDVVDASESVGGAKSNCKYSNKQQNKMYKTLNTGIR